MLIRGWTVGLGLLATLAGCGGDDERYLKHSGLTKQISVGPGAAHPSVAWTGTSYALAWDEGAPGESATIKAAESPFGTSNLLTIVDLGPGQRPRIAAEGGFGVAFVAPEPGTNDDEIFFTTVRPSGQRQQITQHSDLTAFPEHATASHLGRYFVAVCATTALASTISVIAIDGSGQTPVARAIGTDCRDVAISADGQLLHVAWTTSGSSPAVMLRALTDLGEPAGAIAQVSATGRLPQFAFASDIKTVVYLDTQSDRRAMVVVNRGAPGSPATLVTDGLARSAASLQMMPQGNVLAWVGDPTLDGKRELFAAEFSADGRAKTIPIVVGSFGALAPDGELAIAGAHDEVVIAFEDSEPGKPQQIYFARVTGL